MLVFETLPVSASNSKYVWTKNLLVDVPAEHHIQVETSLAVDAQQRVWLTFIDADFHELVNHVPKKFASHFPLKSWIAWPRVVRLFQSVDGGLSFKAQPDLDPLGDTEVLTTTTTGDTFCAHVKHVNNMHEKLALKNLSSFDQAPLYLESGSDPTGVNISAGLDGTINLVSQQALYSGKDTAHPLIFSRSADGGKGWSTTQRLSTVGGSPASAETAQALFIVGTRGFCRSADKGVSFSETIRHDFGSKLVSVTSNLDRSELFVVGDAIQGGLYLQSSKDDGTTFSKTRIDTAKTAQSWRYPAVCVDGADRLHVVWMDDRTGYGALYHAYSDDHGKSFSKNSCISDEQFPFPADAPWPPPGDQSGKWVGNHLAIAGCGDNVIVAWSDQRSGHTKSKVYVSVGTSKHLGTSKHRQRAHKSDKHKQ